MTDILWLKWVSILLIVLVTLSAGIYPFLTRLEGKKGQDFPIGEALASGVFLGAGLMHMLREAAQSFFLQQVKYPIAFFLAGAMFLFLLWLEHIGREFDEHQDRSTANFAILAVVMLSLHSFLSGAALGLSETMPVVLVILLAILAHKWAASFALAVQINKSSLSTRTAIGLFSIFALMAPLGIVMGNLVTEHLRNYPLLEPTFEALAAGTFIYLGTLHGLRRSVMVEKCCNLKHFSFVIFGFVLMALVAVLA